MSTSTTASTPEDIPPLRRSALVQRLRGITRLYKRRRLPFTHFLNAFQGKIVVVEGIIGIGKSTLCESLTDVLNESGVRTEYIPETFDPALLGAFLARQKELDAQRAALEALRAEVARKNATRAELAALIERLEHVLIVGSSLFPTQRARELEEARTKLAVQADDAAALETLMKAATEVLADARNEHAASFQFDMQARRHADAQRALDLQKQGVTTVIDRSLTGDYAFARMQHEDGNLSTAEWDEYCDRAEAADLLEPDLIYFLHSRPAVALERCTKRSRSGEDAYTLAYFRRLTNTYFACFEAVETPCLFVDWSVARELDPTSGRLDRAVVLDVLAHGAPVFAPMPLLLPHQNHARWTTDGSDYAQYGVTRRLADMTEVRFGPEELPRRDGEQTRVAVYVPDEDTFVEFTVSRNGHAVEESL